MAFEPADGGSRTLIKDEFLWRVPLRWPKAAVIEQAVQLSADDRRVNLNVGDVLAQTRLQFDDQSLAGATSFCVPRLADPNKATGGLLGGMLARSMTDAQFCIVDRDNNGTADMSVMINGGSPAARTPVAITPIRYRADYGVEVGRGDYAQLTYRGGRKFELEIFEQGSKRRFDTLTTTGNLGRETFGNLIRRTKLGDGSEIYVVPSGTLHLRTYDASTGSITVDWEPRKRLKLLPVPDEIQVRYRFY